MHHPMPMHVAATPECLSRAQVALILNMRSLWEQHVTWTVIAIRSLVYGLPDTEPVLARLLQNATDMGDALKPIYGVLQEMLTASLLRSI